MINTDCIFCGAEAARSDTQGVFARFRCQGKCGRFVVSETALRHITSSPSAQALKTTWSEQAAREHATGGILLLRFVDEQFKPVRITQEHTVWSQVPW